MNGHLASVTEAELSRLAVLPNPFRADTRLRARSARPLPASSGLDFRELRPYRGGDDIRRVDWRASARQQLPVLRSFDDESGASWLLCLDTSASMSADDGRRWPLALQVTAALGYRLLDAGLAAGLVTFDRLLQKPVPAGTGRRHYPALAVALGQTESSGPSRFDALHTLPPRGHLVVVTDALIAGDAGNMLLRLAETHRAVHLVTLRSAVDIPRIEAPDTLLVDSESGDRLVVSPAARSVAAARLADHDRQLQRLAREAGIALTACDTGATWQQVVARHALTRHAHA